MEFLRAVGRFILTQSAILGFLLLPRRSSSASRSS